MVKAVAISPAGLSSFFEICDEGPDSKPLSDPMRVGARGGGFTVAFPLRTEVIAEEKSQSSVKVFINGKLADARTTKSVVEKVLKLAGGKHRVEVHHEVPVPTGAGFGTSGAGALCTALALSSALGLKLSYTQIGRIAHSAEVECKTGLGTVAPLMVGGPCVVTVKPGAPGIAVVERIPVPEKARLVCAVFSSIETRELLLKAANKAAINSAGREALRRILEDPCLETFMDSCRKFALKSGLATERTAKLMETLAARGLLCAQNMVGEAVHVVARDDEELEEAMSILESFSLGKARTYVANLTWSGAKLVEVVE